MATPGLIPTVTTDSPITFRYDRMVSQEDRTLIQTGITLADDYLQRIGFRLTPATVYGYVQLDNIAPDWRALAEETGTAQAELVQRFPQYVALAFPSAVFISTAAPAWQDLTAVHQIRLAAHEYFHLAQYRLVGAEVTREFYGAEIGRETPLGPNWLLEGSAEYFSWRVMQDAELLSLNDYVRRLDTRDDVDPAGLETYLDFYLTGQDSYDASLRAVAFLLASNDEQDLMRYYFEIGRGETWRDAFRSSFGQSLESFYQAYGDYIASR